MRDVDWKPIGDVMRMVSNLPFPERFYKAEMNSGIDNDALYIQEQLQRLSLHQRAKAVDAYENLYEGDESRFECNTRLRNYADKCEAARNGKTIKPRRVIEVN